MIRENCVDQRKEQQLSKNSDKLGNLGSVFYKLHFVFVNAFGENSYVEGRPVGELFESGQVFF